MFISAVAFLAGIVALQSCAALPPAYSYLLVATIPVLWRWPLFRAAAFFLIGFFWALFRAELALAPALDPGLEGQTVRVEGRVLGIPEKPSAHKSRFLFFIDRIETGQGWQNFKGKVRLSVYGRFIDPVVGEHWRLAVRLKRPHGFANPGGFDYERWLFQKRIRATGYVRKDSRNQILSLGHVWPITSLRSRLKDEYAARQDETSATGMVAALTIGDRGGIDPAQWQVLRSTGTSHLVAISGLHISLVAGLVFWLVQQGWRWCGALPGLIPAKKAAGVAAMLAALLYALLAGFGIPTQRALIMVSVFMFALASDRHSTLPRALCLAAFATLVYDPLSVLSAGWWLSFWAVSVIAWLVTGRHGKTGLWKKWVFMHLVLGITMLPLLLVFFQQASLVAPLANMVAVPWVSMLVVPLALLGTLLFSVHETAGTMVLEWAAQLLDLLWPLLEWMARLEYSEWLQHQPVAWTLAAALAGLAILFVPRGVPARWCGLVLLLPLFLVRPPVPERGEFRMTQLDVGQGLSTVIQTHEHVLVYDAGPKFSDSFDAGSAVVVPFLRHQGIHRIDTLAVSHGDNDHIGGVASLLGNIRANRVITGVPDRLAAASAKPCVAGDQWNWDGVQFTVLYPPAGDRRRGNNASCVLRVETANAVSILLTGDIEASAERDIEKHPRTLLEADVLVVPHHGSLTSSTPGFLQAVSPSTAIFPAGYRNRYGFPKTDVVERYDALGSDPYITGVDGAVTVSSNRDHIDISRYRESRRRYWQN